MQKMRTTTEFYKHCPYCGQKLYTDGTCPNCNYRVDHCKKCGLLIRTVTRRRKEVDYQENYDSWTNTIKVKRIEQINEDVCGCFFPEYKQPVTKTVEIPLEIRKKYDKDDYPDLLKVVRWYVVDTNVRSERHFGDYFPLYEITKNEPECFECNQKFEKNGTLFIKVWEEKEAFLLSVRSERKEWIFRDEQKPGMRENTFVRIIDEEVKKTRENRIAPIYQFIKLIDEEDKEAVLKIAGFLQSGYTYEKDEYLALACLDQATYIYGGDYQESFDSQMKRVANPESKTDIHDMYRKVQKYLGIKAYDLAFPLLYELALLGDPKAAESVGEYFKSGLVVKKNPILAFRFYEMAKTGRRMHKWEAYSEMVPYPDPTMSVEENVKVADKLCFCRNVAGAMYYRRQAAALYDLKSQVWLARHYLNERGDFYCPEEGMKWLKIAVEQGNLEAYRLLGSLYEDGRIVEKDIAKANVCYQKGHLDFIFYDLFLDRHPELKEENRNK